MHASLNLIIVVQAQNEVTTEKIVSKMYDILLNDHYMKIHTIVNISHGLVLNILNADFCIGKLLRKRVPSLSTVDLKWNCVTISKQSLGMFKCISSEGNGV